MESPRVLRSTLQDLSTTSFFLSYYTRNFIHSCQCKIRVVGDVFYRVESRFLLGEPTTKEGVHLHSLFTRESRGS